MNERVAGGSTWVTRCGGEREGSGRVNAGIDEDRWTVTDALHGKRLYQKQNKMRVNYSSV